MGVQLTTLLHRAGLWPGSVAPWPGGGLAPWTRPDGAGDVRDGVARARRARLDGRDRARYDALVVDAGHAGAPVRDVLVRTLAAHGTVAAVEEIAGLCADRPTLAAGLHDPVSALGRAARQVDGTTCGSAVLAVVAALGDPALAAWLLTGATLAAAAPPELSAASGTALERLAGASVERRSEAVQRVLKARTTRRALVGLPWPPALGTPPWAAARAARFPGAAFAGVVLDDTDRGHLDGVLDQVGLALDHGVPVPLYSGGDSDGGWAAAVPRHVVLAVGRSWHGGTEAWRETDHFTLWEPSAGSTHEVARQVLVAGSDPVPALGRWSHLTWALLPHPPAA